MLIYNVTINVDPGIEEAWLAWMRQTHIPEMLATGKFQQARMCRVLVEEETGGITYAIQYHTGSRKLLEAYYREDAERMRRDGTERFGDSFVAFRTELQVVSEHLG